MDLWYVISMIGKGGKNLYLACTDKDNVMKWTDNLEEACWFETGYDADKFARSYFKQFKRYYVTAFNYNINQDKYRIEGRVA